MNKFYVVLNLILVVFLISFSACTTEKGASEASNNVSVFSDNV